MLVKMSAAGIKFSMNSSRLLMSGGVWRLKQWGAKAARGLLTKPRPLLLVLLTLRAAGATFAPVIKSRRNYLRVTSPAFTPLVAPGPSNR